MNNTFRLDLANVPKELVLILELLKRDEYAPPINPHLFKDIDWKLFIEQVNHHRLYPPLYPKLKLLAEKSIPINVMKKIEESYRKNTFQMLLLTAEMEQINKLFNEVHIKSIFLKGPVLAKELYGDISLRTSSDLDVLIPIHQLEEAECLLISLGYEKDDYIQSILNDWKWRHHHVTYIHPQKKIKVEIHWRLHPGPGKEPSFEQLWKRKAESSLIKSPAYLLGKEDLFFFLVTHGARHGWSRLRWLLDIKQLMKQELNWEQLNQLFKNFHFLPSGGQVLVLTLQLFKAEFDERMNFLLKDKHVERLAQQTIFYLERMVNLHADLLEEEVSRYHKHYLFSLMSIQQKSIFILSFLFPYPEDAGILPLPKKLHFLYFPLRPFLWACRKKGKKMTYHGRMQ